MLLQINNFRIMRNLLYAVLCTGCMLFISSEAKSEVQFKEKNKSSKKDSTRKEEFLIGIFWGPVWEHTNDEQYKTIKDANVDYIQSVVGSDLDAKEKNFKMLDLAQKHGLKIYVADKRIKGSDDDIKAMIETYKDHPATGGYYVQDEPNVQGLDWAAKTYKKVLSHDPNRVPYVNLLPNWAIQGDYEKTYVDKWIEKVGKNNLKYLSFDQYPFMEDGGFRGTYYPNLDIIRKTALRNNLRTSCYLQSVGIEKAYRRPSPDELRFSMYANIAYGIKNIVWFTYWTPTKREEIFTNAIIDPEGKKTDLYAPFSTLNGEVKQLGKVLATLEAVDVYHTGSNIPPAAEKLPQAFVLQPQQSNDELIISNFKDKTGRKNYVMVVNKSFTTKKQLSFKVLKSTKQILQVSKVKSSKTKLLKTDYSKKTGMLTDTFLAGEGKLYEIH